ncbi:MAG: hypothetical protein QM784_32755 [Polyangiaceae bacterium]
MEPVDTPFSELPPIEQYARVLGKLTEPGADFERVLAECGLTEETWTKLEDDCDALLSSDELSEDETVELLGKLASGIRPTGGDDSNVSIDFDTWRGLCHASQAGQDLGALLGQRRLRLEDFLVAQAYWLRRVTTEPALMARYRGERQDP